MDLVFPPIWISVRTPGASRSSCGRRAVLPCAGAELRCAGQTNGCSPPRSAAPTARPARPGPRRDRPGIARTSWSRRTSRGRPCRASSRTRCSPCWPCPPRSWPSPDWPGTPKPTRGPCRRRCGCGREPGSGSPCGARCCTALGADPGRDHAPGAEPPRAHPPRAAGDRSSVRGGSTREAAEELSPHPPPRTAPTGPSPVRGEAGRRRADRRGVRGPPAPRPSRRSSRRVLALR